MNKIINQKRYNTDTAQYIGYWCNDYLPGDLYYTLEHLYRKKTGEFFLYCTGGPGSIYGGKEELKPLSYEQAAFWAEKNLNADEYEKFFGEIVENDEMETISMTLPKSTAEKLRRIVSQTGKTYGTVITELLDK